MMSEQKKCWCGKPGTSSWLVGGGNWNHPGQWASLCSEHCMQFTMERPAVVCAEQEAAMKASALAATPRVPPERVAELDRLEKAATPGPWSRHDTGTLSGIMAGELPQNRAYLTPADKGKRICYLSPGREEKEANLDLIVAVRNALPGLLADLTDARAENERLRQRAEAAEARVLRLEANVFATAKWLLLERKLADEGKDDPGIMGEAFRERIAEINALLDGTAGASKLRDLAGERDDALAEVARLQQRIRELEAPPDDGR